MPRSPRAGIASSVTTYKLTIDTVHTYYVEAGATPVLVHNCPAKKGKPKQQSRQTGKQRASDIPSWVNPEEALRRPGESPAQAANRVMSERYPEGYKTGPNTEYNKILKFISRNPGRN